jgi:hypothetical protein
MENESTSGIIYKTTNLIDGKIYVGQTTRKDHSNYYGSGIWIARALEKYGLSAFEKEIICECFNKKELNEKEIFWIASLSATDHNVGYNIDNGGKSNNYNKGKIYINNKTKDKVKKVFKKDLEKYLNNGWEKGGLRGCRIRICNEILKKEKNIKKENLEKWLSKDGWKVGGLPRSEKCKRKLSKANKGKKLPLKQIKNYSEQMAGRILIYNKKLDNMKRIPKKDLKKYLKAGWEKGVRDISEEHKRNLSKAGKGKIFTKEHRKNMSGKNNAMSKMVICIETNQVFDTIGKAAGWAKVSSGTISYWIKNNKRGNGYTWEYYIEKSTI